MATVEECKQAIFDRMVELIPTATATTLPKLTDALANLSRDSYLDGFMTKYMDLMNKNKEEENALIQRPSL